MRTIDLGNAREKTVKAKKKRKMDKQRDVSAATTKSRKIFLMEIAVYMPKAQKMETQDKKKTQTNGRTKGLFAAVKTKEIYA